MEFKCKQCRHNLNFFYPGGICIDCHNANLSKTVADKLELHHKMTEQYKFNQQSNFLYHFVNKFTDTEVPIEAIREELKKLLEK